MDKYIPPPLKWVGGKMRLLPQLLSLLPAGKRLIEPFVGSGAVFLNTNYPAYMLNDINHHVIIMYRLLRQHPEVFIPAAERFFKEESARGETGYYNVRDSFNDGDYNSRILSPSVAFLYLNKHCFNGVCRFNQAGEFNVSYGKYKKVTFPTSALNSFTEKLNSTKVDLYHLDFETIIEYAGAGDVVYCDPPYHNNFTGYTAQGFSIEDQERLVTVCRRAVERGASVVISNSIDAIDFYDGFTIHKITARRSVSANGDRENAQEIIAVLAPITN